MKKRYNYRTFNYIIDLNERGYFHAHIENSESENIVFSFSNENEEEDENGNTIMVYGSLWLIEDGFINNIEDLRGIKKYLVNQKIMTNLDELVLVGSIR